MQKWIQRRAHHKTMAAAAIVPARNVVPSPSWNELPLSRDIANSLGVAREIDREITPIAY